MRPYHRIFDIESEANGLITIDRRLDGQVAHPDLTQEGQNLASNLRESCE
jgi:hypothetical protein